jgi:hypothetical protein
MTGRRILKAASVLAVIGLCMAAPVHAAQADDDVDDQDAAQQLAQDIGCVATYDVILAAGQGKIKAQETLRHARDAALEAFRQDSDLPEADVRADVAQAARMLPNVLKESHQSLADYKAGCDAAFMANPFADSDAQPL